mmetsp:Transcript_12787/g.39263  ORF Transcript_12787/g.39263 Transcript_12787/m.39263 type:complete len:137 (-) Transcript_12787:41-451(-)
MLGASIDAMRGTVVVILLALVALSLGATQNCRAVVEKTIEFPDILYADFNPFLKDDPEYNDLVNKLVNGSCNPDRDAGEVCASAPAFGSGLSQLYNGDFIALTDRGPNQDCEDLCGIDPKKYADACGKKGKGCLSQ